MLAKMFFALLLLAGCVSIHAAGLSAAFRWMPRRREFYAGYWHWTGVFVCLAAWMILLHLLEIAVWALFPAETCSIEILARLPKLCAR